MLVVLHLVYLAVGQLPLDARLERSDSHFTAESWKLFEWRHVGSSAH